MEYFERTITLPIVVYSNCKDRQIILSDNGRKYIASKIVGEKWVVVKQSTSYNACFNALIEKKEKVKE